MIHRGTVQIRYTRCIINQSISNFYSGLISCCHC